MFGQKMHHSFADYTKRPQYSTWADVNSQLYVQNELVKSNPFRESCQINIYEYIGPWCTRV